MQGFDTYGHGSGVLSQNNLIFVVDDESMIGEMVEIVLSMEGFIPRVFTDPEKAFEAFERAAPRPELLLTDFRMSPINGMELIQKCKRLQPDLKTILYSGNVSRDITLQYPLRPDAFLSKPFLPRTLSDLVRSVLGGGQ